MDYGIFAAFAVPALTGLTIVAYKHPDAYKKMVRALLPVVAYCIFALVTGTIAYFARQIGPWPFIIAACLVYAGGLYFLHDLISHSENESRPRQDDAKKDTNDESSPNT